MQTTCVAVCSRPALCRPRNWLCKSRVLHHSQPPHSAKLRACLSKCALSCASAAAKRGSALRTPRLRKAARAPPPSSSSSITPSAKPATASATPSAARAMTASSPAGASAAAALCRLPGLPSNGAPLSQSLLTAASRAAARRLSASRRALAAGAAVAGAARSGSAALPPALPEARPNSLRWIEAHFRTAVSKTYIKSEGLAAL